MNDRITNAVTERARGLLSELFVAVPYHRLIDEFMESVLAIGANLELGIHAESLDRFSRRDFEETAKLFRERGIRTTMHCAFMDLVPASPDPLIRRASQDRIRQVFELLPVFRPLCVACHTGYSPVMHEDGKEEWVERSVEFWNSMIPAARENGAFITLENVFEPDPETLAATLDGIDSPTVRFLFDTGHTLAFSKTSWEGWMNALGPRLGQIHAHDNTGHSDEHRAVGGGIFPFDDLFAWLDRTGSRPVITLEAHSMQWVWESLPVLDRLWPWERGTGPQPR